MNNNESNYFIPVLSAIAGIGAIVTVFAPFLLQNNQISQLFVNTDSIQIASVISIIVAVISIWYASSNQSYEVFPSGKALLLKQIIVFIILGILFYSLKVLANSFIAYKDLASILQLTSYVFGYFVLGSLVGLLLRDSFGAYRYQKTQIEKYDRFRDALFKSGLLKADLIIESIVQRPYNSNDNNPQFFSAHNVIFATEKGKFFAIVSSDYSQILHSEEVKPVLEVLQQNKQTK